MSLFLCVETSSQNCSVALFEDLELVGLKEDNSGYSHAENLHPFIDLLIKEQGRSLSELDAIIVGAGPGSFTGLRIGVAACKALCYILEIPLISVPTLWTMSKNALDNVKDESAVLCPMIDARRMEVYTALFNSECREIKSPEAKILDENSFSEELLEYELYFFGSGMPKWKEFLGKAKNAHYVDGIEPSALKMIELGKHKYDHGEFEDVAYYEPYYLKDFQPTTPRKK